MRSSLFLITICLLTVFACKKSKDPGERWVEKTQGQEVIVFQNEKFAASNGVERSFYFQSRAFPVTSSVSSPSGIYLYAVEGDTLQLKTSGQRVYFKMSADGKSFTIGRFFVNYSNLPALLTFEKR